MQMKPKVGSLREVSLRRNLALVELKSSSEKRRLVIGGHKETRLIAKRFLFKTLFVCLFARCLLLLLLFGLKIMIMLANLDTR